VTTPGTDDPAAVPIILGAAAARNATVTGLDRQLVAQAAVEWARLDINDLQGSFVDEFLPAIRPALTTAQTVSANVASQAIAQRTGKPSSVIPSGFAGHAATGETLGKALSRPLVQMYVDLGLGTDPSEARTRSFDVMDQILTGEVHDAARQAESVQMVAHTVTYYIRHTEPGACALCIVLSGKHYKVNAGFQRHPPTCRCYHIPGSTTYYDPVNGGPGVGTVNEIESPYHTKPADTPKALFDAMSPAQQDATFGRANAQAIRDGADLTRVVNATMNRSGLGTTITGPLGERYKGTIQGMPVGQSRLIPEAIYKIAGDDDAYARRLLQQNGYIR
jgi:hypothetical protein